MSHIGRAPEHILLLRHGQTELSASGVFASRTEAALTEAGRASARAWAPFLGDVDAGVVAWTSPQGRAVETAALAGTSAQVQADLAEWDLGELELRDAEHHRATHPHWSLYVDGPPGGESSEAVTRRADRVVAAARGSGASTLVLVGHGQFSRVLTTRLLGLDLALGARFSMGPGRAGLVSWRASVGAYVLSGWNRPPAPLGELLVGNS